MPSTPVDPGLDLSDPDLVADHLPLDEFAWLRRHQPVRWNPQPSVAAYGDAGFWAVTRHADLAAVTRGPEWSVEANSAFVRRLDESDPTGEIHQEPPALHGPAPAHPRAQGGEPVLHARAPWPGWRTSCANGRTGSCGPPSRTGTGDFVMDVARHLPLQAIAGLMGIPDQDRQQLFDWSDQMAGSEDPEYADADLSGVVEMFAYAHAAAEARVDRRPRGRHQPARAT